MNSIASQKIKKAEYKNVPRDALPVQALRRWYDMSFVMCLAQIQQMALVVLASTKIRTCNKALLTTRKSLQFYSVFQFSRVWLKVGFSMRAVASPQFGKQNCISSANEPMMKFQQISQHFLHPSYGVTIHVAIHFYILTPLSLYFYTNNSRIFLSYHYRACMVID